MDVSLPVDIKNAKLQSSKKSHIQFHELSESLQDRIRKWLMYVKVHLPGTFESTPELSKYIFVVLSVMAMSAVIWGTIWKEGTFDEFIKHQYDRLNDWAEQRVLQIKVLKLQEKGQKAKVILEKKMLEQKEQKEALISFSNIWNKILSLSSSGMYQLWTSELSWVTLWSSWTYYFSDPFGMIPGMPPKSVQFHILCFITVIKIVVYVYDLIKNKFSQIFDIYDRTFVPRIILAIIKSFIKILNAYVPQNRQRESSLIQNQILALEATERNLSNLNVDELDEFIRDPTEYSTMKEQIQKLLSEVANLCETKIKIIAKGTSLYLKPFNETKYAGQIEIPGALWTKKTYSMLDSTIFYSIWINIAESVIQYDKIFKEVQKVNTTDEIGKKRKSWLPERWTKSKDKLVSLQNFIKNKILKNCNSIKNNLQKIDVVQGQFILDIPEKLMKLAKIDFQKEFKEDSKDSDFNFNFDLDYSDKVNNFFISNTDRKNFASVLTKLKNITSSCSKKNIQCYVEEMETAAELLRVFETEIKERKMTYVNKLRTIYNRNIFLIELCGTMCRLLQYFISGYDAFVLACSVFEDNKEVPEDISNFQQSPSHHKAILFSLQNYQSLKTSTSSFITFKNAKSKIVDPLLDIDKLKIYVNRASMLMCKIINADKIISDVKDDDEYVNRIAQLYAIENFNDCETVPDCENCVCSKDDNTSPIQLNDEDVIKSNLDAKFVDTFASIVAD